MENIFLQSYLIVNPNNVTIIDWFSPIMPIKEILMIHLSFIDDPCFLLRVMSA